MPLAGAKVPAAPATVGLPPPVFNVITTLPVGTVVPSSVVTVAVHVVAVLSATDVGLQATVVEVPILFAAV
jgi:hypothetical protein